MAGMTKAWIVFLPQQPWQRHGQGQTDRRGCGEEGGGHGTLRGLRTRAERGRQRFEWLNLASPPIPCLCRAGGDWDEGEGV